MAIAAGHEGLALGNDGGAIDGAFGLDLPNDRRHRSSRADAGAEDRLDLELAELFHRRHRQAIEVAVVRANDHVVAGEVGAAGDLATGLEFPPLLARSRIDAIEHAVLVADEHLPLIDARRRLDGAELRAPFLFAGRQVVGVQMVIEAANVDRVLDDGGRRFDALLEIDLPANLQLVGQRRLRHARLQRIAAKQRPIRLRRLSNYRSAACEQDHRGHHRRNLRGCRTRISLL